MNHPDPAMAIALGIQTAFALMQQHVLIEETHVRGRALSDEELRRELTTMFLRYVGIHADAGHGDARKRTRRRQA